MTKITSLSAALLSLSLCMNSYSSPLDNVSKADGDFLGVFTIEPTLKGCTVLDSTPLRAIASYRHSMTTSEIVSWIDGKTGDFKTMAINNGMNAIVGFRENLSLSSSSGIITLTGVGVKFECITSKSTKAPTSKSGIPQY